MRFSNPITTSRLFNPISASIIRTLYPFEEIAIPKEAVIDVFPTPPFPEVTTILRAIFTYRKKIYQTSVSEIYNR